MFDRSWCACFAVAVVVVVAAAAIIVTVADACGTVGFRRQFCCCFLCSPAMASSYSEGS